MIKNILIAVLVILVAILSVLLFKSENRAKTESEVEQSYLSESGEVFSNKLTNETEPCLNCEDVNDLVGSKETSTESSDGAVSDAGSIPMDEETLQRLISPGDSQESLNDMFDSEAIDYAWSNKIEENINIEFQSQKSLSTLQELNVAFQDIECKSSMCKVSFESFKPIEDEGKAQKVLQISKLLLKEPEIRNMNSRIFFTDDNRVIYMMQKSR